jgi:hypothetical protein
MARPSQPCVQLLLEAKRTWAGVKPFSRVARRLGCAHARRYGCQSSLRLKSTRGTAFGLRALVFDIGFFRKVCTNGLILQDAIIQFKFSHMRRDIGEQIHFQVDHDRLAKLKGRFGEYVAALRACPVPRKDLASFVRKVLALRPLVPLEPNTREADDWNALSTYVADMCDRYAADLGDNAYAVFNAVTEFASHPPGNRFVRRDRNSLQRLAGEWVSGFSQQCRRPDFDLTGYLAGLKATKAEAAIA